MQRTAVLNHDQVQPAVPSPRGENIVDGFLLEGSRHLGGGGEHRAALLLVKTLRPADQSGGSPVALAKREAR